MLIVIPVFYLFGPMLFKTPKQPVRPYPQPMKYSYYKIVDQSNDKVLMYISSGPVGPGDSLITENNRRFVVVRVVGNKAYAKYVGKEKM
jgi:hypothetical protein